MFRASSARLQEDTVVHIYIHIVNYTVKSWDLIPSKVMHDIL